MPSFQSVLAVVAARSASDGDDETSANVLRACVAGIAAASDASIGKAQAFAAYRMFCDARRPTRAPLDRGAILSEIEAARGDAARLHALRRQFARLLHPDAGRFAGQDLLLAEVNAAIDETLKAPARQP